MRMAGAPRRRTVARLLDAAGLWNGCVQPARCRCCANAYSRSYGNHATCAPNRAPGGVSHRSDATAGHCSGWIRRVERARGAHPRRWRLAGGWATVFPYGFALYPQYNTQEFRPETLRSIAASGFNTLHAPIRLNYPELQADAAALGMRLIAEIYPYELDDAGIVRAIRHVKDGPALLAYAIADDVDDGEYYTPELVTRINQLVKTVDRQYPTYISGFVPQRINLFMQSADTVAMQSYPIGKTYWEHARIGHVNYALATAIAAARPFNRPVIANLQAFAWPEQRQPTPPRSAT